MQPFSKRPSHQPQPVFHRQEAIGHSSYTPGGYAYPPPPHSLAPVAMGQYAERSYPTDRGVANTVHVRAQRPTWRTGAMILLAGVFVGGTFGVGVQARRNAMEAQADIANAGAQPVAAAQAPQQVAPAIQAPMQAIAPGPTALQTSPPQQPPQAYAQAPAAPNLPPGAIVIPPQAGVTVTAPAAPQAPIAAAPAAQPKKAAAPAWHAPSRPAAPAAHGGMVAAKVQPPKPEKAAAPPPPPTEKAEKPEKAEKAGAKKGTSDAEKILKDAIGETTNTL